MAVFNSYREGKESPEAENLSELMLERLQLLQHFLGKTGHDLGSLKPCYYLADLVMMLTYGSLEQARVHVLLQHQLTKLKFSGLGRNQSRSQ